MPRYRFADVELDVDRFDVTRAGRRLALEPKAIEVLRFLVERPGRLVTKDELLDGVWADVAVTPNAVTRIIAQLRRELGDDAAAARVIETVPTRGYRFIAEVHQVPAPGSGVPEPAGSVPVPAAAPPDLPPRGTAAAPARRSPWRLALAAALVALVGAGVWMVGGRRSSASSEAGTLRAVEGEAGSILAAAFSPDGRWLAVVSDRTGDFEISVRDLQQGTSHPVTADGMRNVHPAWSPDSSAIAYHSSLRKGIWVIGRHGGVARQVAAAGSRPAWSPDGRWIAFQTDEWVSEWAQPGSRIVMVPADGSGPPQALTRAGDPPGGHWHPLWSPDGTLIYFGSARNGPTDYWSVRVRDGLLTKRADNWTYHVRQLTAGPTGVSAWIVEWPVGGNRLVRLGVGDEAAGPPLPAEVMIPSLPGAARSVSIAPGGRTAALVLVEPRQYVWTVPVTASGAPAGAPRRLHPGGHPAISPDGRRIAYDTGGEVRVMNLDGSGDRSVITGRRVLYPSWLSDRRLFAMLRVGLSPYLVEADLETGAVSERLPLPEAATFPRVGPDGDTVTATLGEPLNTTGRGSLSAGTFGVWPLFDGYSFPVWSPDGRRLALEKKEGAHMPMYLADVATGDARRVSPAAGQFWPGSFSPDGRRLAISTLGERGVWNIETLDPETGVRTAVTAEIDPEVITRYPSWSPRGDLIAYDRTDARGTLYLVDLPPAGRSK